eukprot:750733-Hanusia_phi.AAC.18
MLYTRFFLFLLLNVCPSGSWFLHGHLDWTISTENPLLVNFQLWTAWRQDAFSSQRLSALTQFEDVPALRKEWVRGLAGGPGGVLNVTEGAVAEVRRRIVLCPFEGCDLPTNESRFNFIITSMDDFLVQARLSFSFQYIHSGRYNVSFLGCCRDLQLENNAGTPWNVRAEVVLYSKIQQSPTLLLPPILHLHVASHYKIYGLSDSCSLQYQLGRYQTVNGVEAFISDYESLGFYITADGELSSSLSTLNCQFPACNFQLSILYMCESIRGIFDLLIHLHNSKAPYSDFDNFLVTPRSTPWAPVRVNCNTSEFFPPIDTEYTVSDCLHAYVLVGTIRQHPSITIPCTTGRDVSCFVGGCT